VVGRSVGPLLVHRPSGSQPKRPVTLPLCVTSVVSLTGNRTLLPATETHPARRGYGLAPRRTSTTTGGRMVITSLRPVVMKNDNQV
jgi:hypothetical protein